MVRRRMLGEPSHFPPHWNKAAVEIAMSHLLQLKGLGVRFGGLIAVDAIDLQISDSEVFGLLGPNGAGKTTLFNMIAGVTRPTNGSIVYQGDEITSRSVTWRARRGIARTFQITQPFEALTVLENVLIGAVLKESRLSVAKEEAKQVLEYVGLYSKQNEQAAGLSTGQRKRLELARALSIKPKLLLMDEVTGGVDQPSIPGLIKLVASLKAHKISVILVEHNMQIMSELCDRMLFMNQGVKLVQGKPQEVLTHPDVTELYLGADV